MARCLHLLLLGALAAALVSPAAAQPIAESASITPAAVTLDPAAESATREALVTLQVDPARLADAMTFGPVADLPGGLALQIAPLGTLQIERNATGTATGTVRQRLRLSFTDIPRRLDATNILIPLRFGAAARVVELGVGNGAAPPANAALSLTLAAESRLDPGGAIPIGIAARGAAAPDITLGAGPFIDSIGKRALAARLCLAAAPKGRCLASVSLASNAQRQLFLIQSGTDPLGSGSFSGSIRLLAANGLEASQPLILHISTGAWRHWGLAALVAGIVLSFCLTILWPHWRDRDQALVPFIELGQRIVAARRQRRGLAASNLEKRSSRIADQLRQVDLEAAGLPPRVPGTSGSSGNPAALKRLLDKLAADVTAIERLSAALADAPADRHDALDAIAGKAQFPPKDIDADINTALGVVTPATRARTAPDDLPSLAMLVERESFRNITAWVVISLVTALFGYVLIVGKPGFGGWDDVLTAFTWALGLSTGGSKLAELTTGSLRTALRPAPRAAP